MTSANSSEMASTFSYAQAAKGEGSSLPSTPVNAPSQTASDDALATEGSQGLRSFDLKSSNADQESVVGSEADSVQPTRRFEPRKEEELSRLERPWRRTDKSARSPSTAARSVDDQDSRRARKGKKLKGSDKQAADEKSQPEQPKIELSEAPIPSVNPWLQKKDAAPAPVPVSKPQPTIAAVVAAEEKKAPKPASEPATNGMKQFRKAVDTTQRNGSRGTRAADKDAKSEIPPAVTDTTLWPTVETAVNVAQEEKKKTTVDKTERFEKESQPEDSAPAKPRQKEKWVAYDYVPTVNFETQLPQMRNTKPRGGARNVNGSRAAGGNQTGDKAPGAAAANKTAEGRNRRESANGTSRTASIPPSSKRASMDVNQVREQRKTQGVVADKSKDTPANQTQEQAQTPRERQDGRNDRGRGGYRGRGGHHAVASQPQHHGAGAFGSNNMGNRPQAPYSPSARQGHGQVFVPGSQRGGRGGRNNGANFHRMSLPNGATRLPPLQQPQFGHYEYPLPPMSAVPFQPNPYGSWGDQMVLPVLKNQIEYYFSIENLCKDMYLRSHMDSQGFVPLHFIAAFKRVRDLSADMGMIRAVCEGSTEIDLIVGEDDMERVRRREGWENWILPVQDRDELARSNGPVRLTFKNRPFAMGHMINGIPAVYGTQMPSAFVPHAEPHAQQYADVQGQSFAMNGVNGDAHHKGSSGLSANVPDFAPSSVNGQSEEKTNGVHAEAPES